MVPTAACLEWAGRSLDSDGIAAHYQGLIDGLVADRRASDVPTLETDVELADADAQGVRRPRLGLAQNPLPRVNHDGARLRTAAVNAEQVRLRACGSGALGL